MKLVPKQVRLSRPSLFQLVKTKEDFQLLAKELVELVEKHIVSIEINKVYALENCGEAHGDLQDKKTNGKIIVDCQQ